MYTKFINCKNVCIYDSYKNLNLISPDYKYDSYKLKNQQMASSSSSKTFNNINELIEDIIKKHEILSYYDGIEEYHTIFYKGIQYDVLYYKSDYDREFVVKFFVKDTNTLVSLDNKIPAIFVLNTDFKPGILSSITIVNDKGETSNLNGPAKIYFETNTKEYWINGKKINPFYFKIKSLQINDTVKYTNNLNDYIDNTIKETVKELNDFKEKEEEKRKKYLDLSFNCLNDLEKFKIKFKDNYLLLSIYNQTKIIHEKFENDEKLNCKYLNQFHEYYTKNLITALNEINNKIKKKKNDINNSIELLIAHKNALNSIDTTNKEINEIELKNYLYNLSELISSIYNKKIHNYTDFRYTTTDAFLFFHNNNILNINLYKIITNNFINVIKKHTQKLIDDGNNFITIDYWNIEKKLLTQLHKNRYVIEFVDIFICKNINANNSLELYKIVNNNTYFILYNNNFISLNKEQLNLLQENVQTNLQEIEHDLKNNENKIKKLKSESDNLINVAINSEIKDTLEKYLQKIQSFDFNEKEIDSESELTNKILDTILNLNVLKI